MEDGREGGMISGECKGEGVWLREDESGKGALISF